MWCRALELTTEIPQVREQIGGGGSRRGRRSRFSPSETRSTRRRTEAVAQRTLARRSGSTRCGTANSTVLRSSRRTPRRRRRKVRSTLIERRRAASSRDASASRALRSVAASVRLPRISAPCLRGENRELHRLRGRGRVRIVCVRVLICGRVFSDAAVQTTACLSRHHISRQHRRQADPDPRRISGPAPAISRREHPGHRRLFRIGPRRQPQGR